MKIFHVMIDTIETVNLFLFMCMYMLANCSTSSMYNNSVTTDTSTFLNMPVHVQS